MYIRARYYEKSPTTDFEFKEIFDSYDFRDFFEIAKAFVRFQRIFTFRNLKKSLKFLEN